MDSIVIGSHKLFRKMSKFNKFIIPLALVKIALVFLVLQLFFSSCEKEDILYGSDLFTEGPVFEIEAQLGNDVVSFETGKDDNGINVGDTLFLDITMESNTLYDELSETYVNLTNPEYHSQFVILDAEGNPVFPAYFTEAGKIDNMTSELYNASFGEITPSGMLMSPVGGSLDRLKIGFVFNTSGAYTFHFLNTPSNLTSSGTVDIYYDRNLEDAKEFKKAYAVYLFDTHELSQDYDLDGEVAKSDILTNAGADQAIIDFTVIDNKNN